VEVRDALARGGVVYICGANRIGQGVLRVLGEILDGGEPEVQELRRSGRIVLESWGEPPKPLDIGAVDPKGTCSSAEGPEVTRERQSKLLLEAVKNGNGHEVERLIALGVDVNFQAGARKYTRIGLRQEVGETALHWAALRGDDAVANCLLEARADPNLRDQDGKAAIHIAAFNGVASVAQRLLVARCDPDIQDARGNTALQWVILAGGSMRMLRLLLKHGAQSGIANDDGELPADVAEEGGAQRAAGKTATPPDTTCKQQRSQSI